MVLGGDDPVAGDPFWSAFRRRRPDVDLILFEGPSPFDPPGAPERPVDRDQLRAIVRGVDAAYGTLLPLLPPDLPEPTATWRAAPGGHAYLVEKGLRDAGGAAGLELLRTLAGDLHERGWAVEAAGDVTRPHLMATNGWIDLDARSGLAATQLTIAGPVVPVAPDDLHWLDGERVRP